VQLSKVEGTLEIFTGPPGGPVELSVDFRTLVLP